MTYQFKQVGDEIVIKSDRNTLINYRNTRGGLALLPTARNRLVYRSTALALNVAGGLQPVRRIFSASLF